MLAFISSMRRLRLRKSVFLLALLMAALAGCDRVTSSGIDKAASKVVAPAPARKPASDVVSAMTDSINYRHDREIKYTLYDLSQTRPVAIGGAIVEPLASGGEKGCCIALPDKWKPGMKVRVDWAEADRKQIYPEKYSRELDIPRYQTPGDLYVVFYPDHEVEVVVSDAEPGHSDWPGKIKQTPWDHCVATVGYKACKAVLPKLFDAKGNRGFCTYVKEINDPEAGALCLSAKLDCMRDYEDEAFCKKILWGPVCRHDNKDDPYCIEKAREKNK